MRDINKIFYHAFMPSCVGNKLFRNSLPTPNIGQFVSLLRKRLYFYYKKITLSNLKYSKSERNVISSWKKIETIKRRDAKWHIRCTTRAHHAHVTIKLPGKVRKTVCYIVILIIKSINCDNVPKSLKFVVKNRTKTF